MILLGLVLVVAAVGVGTAVVVENTEAVGLTVFGGDVPGVTEEGQVFLAGVVVAIVFAAGITVALLGIKRLLGLRR